MPDNDDLLQRVAVEGFDAKTVKERHEVMLREAWAFIKAHTHIVDCASLMADFALVILDLKNLSVRKQIALDRAARGFLECTFCGKQTFVISEADESVGFCAAEGKIYKLKAGTSAGGENNAQ